MLSLFSYEGVKTKYWILKERIHIRETTRAISLFLNQVAMAIPIQKNLKKKLATTPKHLTPLLVNNTSHVQ